MNSQYKHNSIKHKEKKKAKSKMDESKGLTLDQI